MKGNEKSFNEKLKNDLIRSVKNSEDPESLIHVNVKYKLKQTIYAAILGYRLLLDSKKYDDTEVKKYVNDFVESTYMCCKADGSDHEEIRS